MQHSERVCDLYAAALERNRDEFEVMARRLHRGASKSQRAEIARFRSNPSGQWLCGRSAVLRLASPPAKPLSRLEEIENTF